MSTGQDATNVVATSETRGKMPFGTRFPTTSPSHTNTSRNGTVAAGNARWSRRSGFAVAGSSSVMPNRPVATAAATIAPARVAKYPQPPAAGSALWVATAQYPTPSASGVTSASDHGPPCAAATAAKASIASTHGVAAAPLGTDAGSTPATTNGPNVPTNAVTRPASVSQCGRHEAAAPRVPVVAVARVMR